MKRKDSVLFPILNFIYFPIVLFLIVIEDITSCLCILPYVRYFVQFVCLSIAVCLLFTFAVTPRFINRQRLFFTLSPFTTYLFVYHFPLWQHSYCSLYHTLPPSLSYTHTIILYFYLFSVSAVVFVVIAHLLFWLIRRLCIRQQSLFYYYYTGCLLLLML